MISESGWECKYENTPIPTAINPPQKGWAWGNLWTCIKKAVTDTRMLWSTGKEQGLIIFTRQSPHWEKSVNSQTIGWMPHALTRDYLKLRFLLQYSLNVLLLWFIYGAVVVSVTSDGLWFMEIYFNKANSFTRKPLEHLGLVEKNSYVFTDNLFPAYVTDLPC